MKIVSAIGHTLTHLTKAFCLSFIIVSAVIAAEGLQHIVEWYLGMYESAEMFGAHQSNPTRLGFGILKAISVIAACYFIPKNLTQKYGPPPRHGSFHKDLIRKLWDPRTEMSGMIAMVILAAPIIITHFKLSELAMGHPLATIILILDSVLIGILALVMGTAIWAGDKTGYDETMSIQRKP